MRAVIGHERGDAVVELVLMLRAEGALDEDARALADVPIQRLRRERRQAERTEDVVRRGDEIGTRVEQRAVEVEADVLVREAATRVVRQRTRTRSRRCASPSGSRT
jgi:hypothetical protein